VNLVKVILVVGLMAPVVEAAVAPEFEHGTADWCHNHTPMTREETENMTVISVLKNDSKYYARCGRSVPAYLYHRIVELESQQRAAEVEARRRAAQQEEREP
jgi:hypothetical protein